MSNATFKDSYWEPAAVNTGSAIDQLNYIAYMRSTHCYLLDKENLLGTLKLGGFDNVTLREFDPDLDLQIHRFNSLYCIARK